MMRAAHWLLPGAALALGIAGGALWPLPQPTQALADDTDWHLPAAATLARHVPQDMSDVTRLLRWDGAGTVEPEQDPASVWRLAGIVYEPEAAVLLITREQPKQAQRFALGDVLPDGSVLIAVDGERVQNQRGDCTSTWQLFHSQPVEQSRGCTQTAREETDPPF